MATLRVSNIGTIVSGDIDSPLASGDTVVAEDGTITYVGDAAGAPPRGEGEVVVDAAGATLIPGLIDNHVHPVIGDFSPRQRILDFIESCLHGGVTSMISAGEPHLPGRPKDRVGTKAEAIVASKAFANARPGGVKVIAGAVILEHGLTEGDFDEMAEAGVQPWVRSGSPPSACRRKRGRWCAGRRRAACAWRCTREASPPRKQRHPGRSRLCYPSRRRQPRQRRTNALALADVERILDGPSASSRSSSAATPWPRKRRRGSSSRGEERR